MNRRRFLLILGGAVLFGVIAIGTSFRRSFRNQIDEEIDQLLASAQTGNSRIVDESDLDGLPAPVQRWLSVAGVVGTSIPSVVRLTQEGEFRLGADKPWMPFHATEYYTTDPPGFLWDVSMRMFPLVDIAGRDRYDEGTGDIEMRLASIYPVARTSGGNLDSGALLRYLNETMWFPAAVLLPNVTWTPIDDTHARATISDSGQSVSAVFEFDTQNRLVNMTAERWNDSEQAMRPWSTPITEQGTFEGISMPVAGSGRWSTGSDSYDYIRLRITDLSYDAARVIRI